VVLFSITGFNYHCGIENLFRVTSSHPEGVVVFLRLWKVRKLLLEIASWKSYLPSLGIIVIFQSSKNHSPIAYPVEVQILQKQEYSSP